MKKKYMILLHGISQAGEPFKCLLQIFQEPDRPQGSRVGEKTYSDATALTSDLNSDLPQASDPNRVLFKLQNGGIYPLELFLTDERAKHYGWPGD